MKTGTKCFQARAGEFDRQWFVIDATDRVLGRLAARIATVLMGKHKPIYTPHVDTGDFVIVLNAGKVKVTGRKKDEVVYMRYTGYPSGHKRITMDKQLQRRPERVLYEAVRRMLPKNALAAHMIAKLKLCTGGTHPHQAQKPTPLPI